MTDRDERIIQAWREGDDETFIRELSLANLESAYRPRDEWDEWTHPDSLRGHILATRDAFDALPWWLRMLARITAWRPFRRSGSGEDR